MNVFSLSFFRVASLALVLPILGMCSSYTASTTGTSLSLGQSTSGSPSSTITLGDGDSYSYTLPYSASYGASGTQTGFFPTVTTTSTTTAADSITVEYFQTFTGTGYAYGTYTETIPLTLGTGVTASGFLLVGTTALPTVSFSGPGSFVGTGSADVESGLPANSVTEEYEITYDFAAATPAGSGGSSPNIATPEPVEIIPAGLSLIGFGLVALRRRRN
jgi:hypothetical protein